MVVFQMVAGWSEVPTSGQRKQLGEEFFQVACGTIVVVIMILCALGIYQAFSWLTGG